MAVFVPLGKRIVHFWYGCSAATGHNGTCDSSESLPQWTNNEFLLKRTFFLRQVLYNCWMTLSLLQNGLNEMGLEMKDYFKALRGRKKMFSLKQLLFKATRDHLCLEMPWVKVGTKQERIPRFFSTFLIFFDQLVGRAQSSMNYLSCQNGYFFSRKQQIFENS